MGNLEVFLPWWLENRLLASKVLNRAGDFVSPIFDSVEVLGVWAPMFQEEAWPSFIARVGPGVRCQSVAGGQSEAVL